MLSVACSVSRAQCRVLSVACSLSLSFSLDLPVTLTLLLTLMWSLSRGHCRALMLSVVCSLSRAHCGCGLWCLESISESGSRNTTITDSSLCGCACICTRPRGASRLILSCQWQQYCSRRHPRPKHACRPTGHAAACSARVWRCSSDAVLMQFQYSAHAKWRDSPGAAPLDPAAGLGLPASLALRGNLSFRLQVSPLTAARTHRCVVRVHYA